MTATQAVQIVKLLLSAYPTQRQRMSEDDVLGMTEAYRAGLGDLDHDTARAAVIRVIHTEQWLPTIARIRIEVGELAHGCVRAGGDAWGDLKALAIWRVEGDVEGIDPLLLRVVQAMGWIQRRTLWRNKQDVVQWHVSPGDNEAADRARFIELYDQLARQERKNTTASPGAGAADAMRLIESTTKKLRGDA